MTPLAVITADDMVRCGACRSAVVAFVKRHIKKIAAAMPVAAVLRLCSDDERTYVMRAAKLDGSGDSYGYGSGYGSGYGYGSGDGYGDGYGSGSGDGYGSGDGQTTTEGERP